MSRRTDPLAKPEELLERTYAYVAYRLGDGPDAEDVTGEAFARALRYRETFDPGRGRPIDWMIGIARRCVQDAMPASNPTAAEAHEMPVPGDLETDTIQRIELAEAVGRLPARDRELIALRYGADLKARDIGPQVGMSTNAVEVALHRALARLRELLADGPTAAEAPQAVDFPQRADKTGVQR
jgi:RNA polymerase sigma factor (sigma-70 family)